MAFQLTLAALLSGIGSLHAEEADVAAMPGEEEIYSADVNGMEAAYVEVEPADEINETQPAMVEADDSGETYLEDSAGGTFIEVWVSKGTMFRTVPSAKGAAQWEAGTICSNMGGINRGVLRWEESALHSLPGSYVKVTILCEIAGAIAPAGDETVDEFNDAGAVIDGME